ncbi:NAD-dependent epimerase/dehydratase family protein [Sphingomonas sp.]|uniref:NAD-dependent epimerase/dehydratase family protein n=1 Tax=Sphingomonas sp. TaxID=28214 RepID=UPI001D59F1A3|nr:NAD-dependent epimerase/dehydratase family protein [Sphingomonas sp.]MBX9796723.1 NAD-dependent epimerase/dehydratase family protein [Sphingomonas sp.]
MNTPHQPGAGVPIVIIGATSGAGRAIHARLGDGGVVGVARQGRADVIVADYLAVRPDIIAEGAVIVNCVGTPTGDAATLDDVNRKVAVAWAAAARAAGAAHFIQLSSFSVYGRAQHVNAQTPVLPETAYGRSKLDAEQKLAALQTADFGVSLLRIPILVGGDRSDKLAQLLRLIVRLRIVPLVRPPVARAMLSYDGLAATICHLVQTRQRGVVVAADPEMFSYDLVARQAREAGLHLLHMPLPRVLSLPLGWVAPALHDRLFASMSVDGAVNIATGALPFRRLSDIISERLAG